MELIRQRIIESVLAGKIEPDEGDVRHRAHGFGPLLPEPDPAEFDPFSLPFWTLTMTLAWVAWREPAAVQVSWDKYCDAFKVWVPATATGGSRRWLLGSHSAVPAITLLARDLVTFQPISTLPPPLFGIDEAWNALRLALSITDLRAFAFAITDGRDRWIEAPEWPMLYPGKIQEDSEGRITAVVETVDRSGVPTYRDVRIPLSLILDAWPVEGVAASGPAAVSKNPRAGGANAREAKRIEKLAVEWLHEEYMRASPDKQTHTQDELYLTAKARFGDVLSERLFKRRVWPASAEAGPSPGWRGGGTPPSRAN